MNPTFLGGFRDGGVRLAASHGGVFSCIGLQQENFSSPVENNQCKGESRHEELCKGEMAEGLVLPFGWTLAFPI